MDGVAGSGAPAATGGIVVAAAGSRSSVGGAERTPWISGTVAVGAGVGRGLGTELAILALASIVAGVGVIV